MRFVRVSASFLGSDSCFVGVFVLVFFGLRGGGGFFLEKNVGFSVSRLFLSAAS